MAALQQMKHMIRQRWIPSLFVLGFFVVVAVNAVLIVMATGSFSGLVVAHPYKKGTEYSRLHQALLDQKELGWQYSLQAVAQGEGHVRLTMQWNDGAALALSNLAVTLEASRPVENIAPLTIDLQPRGGGRYEAQLELPREGLWDLRIAASQGERRFLAAERIRVQ